MEYIVLDLEWNMPEIRGQFKRSPIILHGEIIQIGAVKLNEELEEIDSFDAIIKPEFYVKMNREIGELTSISNEDLENGISFKEAIKVFQDWLGLDYILITWGTNDRLMLEENLIVHNLDCEWIPEHYDAQLMFDYQETMEDRNFSLDYAMYYFDIKGIKAHHALNDARDTAAVIRNLNLSEFIAEEREW